MEKEILQEVLMEKTQAAHAEEPGKTHTEILQGSAALAAATRIDPPNPRSKALIQLYGFCMLAFLCSSMNGYDGSLLNAILAMKPFQRQFDASILGAKTGLISGMYTIGGVVALPFVGPCTDTWGRRAGMFIGCAFVVVGTIVSATSRELGQFMGGRFLLGFGVSIAASAAPTYVVEISHPSYRGILTGLYNCTYYVGSITAAGCTRGTVVYDTNKAWIIPVWVQMVCSGLVCLFVFLIPESPRWLFSHGHKDEAFAILTKYHGEGNPENAFVKLQMREYEEEISLDGSDKRIWDYRQLFNTHNARWRVACMLIPSVFGQWSGGGVVSYYLPAMLSTAGVTDPVKILNINLGNSLVSASGAYLGASFVQRLGRRRTLIGVCVACSILFACISAGTGIYHYHPSNNSAATAGIAFIFLFGFFYSFGWTPLQALYPVEVLSYEQRAKGMALSSAAVNAASLLNQFAWPVALQKIGWCTYLIFVGWDLIEAAVCYFVAVETNGRTLEELGEIFDAPNPPKESMRKKEVVVSDQTMEIVDIKDVTGSA